MRLIKRFRFYLLFLIAVTITIVAILGPVLAPMDPYVIDLEKGIHPPNNENIFGTDRLGRDLFSRLLFGARNSFAMTLVMVISVACLGSVIGMISGYAGGFVDTAAMQVADVLLAFPSVVFVIAVVGILGPGIIHTLCALAVICWAKYARMTRGLVMEIKQKDYITQARFGGATWRRILHRYIFPNILPQIIIIMTLDVGEMLITLSALSFLGLVGRPPAPEWGSMLADSRSYIVTYPFMMIYPALAILIIVVVFNLLGDSLRDVLDPKLKKG
jgi:ABC-type dipeptide/oligopeptide/nickel transport system permease subunit